MVLWGQFYRSNSFMEPLFPNEIGLRSFAPSATTCRSLRDILPLPSPSDGPERVAGKKKKRGRSEGVFQGEEWVAHKTNASLGSSQRDTFQSSLGAVPPTTPPRGRVDEEEL